MSQQMEMTYEQELLARGAQMGESRGEARGKSAGQLEAYRAILLRQLQERFQSVPESLVQQIASADLPTLEKALVQVVHIQTLDELQL